MHNFDWEPKGKRSIGRPRRKWDYNNTERDLRGMECEVGAEWKWLSWRN
jgi:hypothetical protein